MLTWLKRRHGDKFLLSTNSNTVNGDGKVKQAPDLRILPSSVGECMHEGAACDDLSNIPKCFSPRCLKEARRGREGEEM